MKTTSTMKTASKEDNLENEEDVRGPGLHKLRLSSACYIWNNHKESKHFYFKSFLSLIKDLCETTKNQVKISKEMPLKGMNKSNLKTPWSSDNGFPIDYKQNIRYS